MTAVSPSRLHVLNPEAAFRRPHYGCDLLFFVIIFLDKSAASSVNALAQFASSVEPFSRPRSNDPQRSVEIYSQ